MAEQEECEHEPIDFEIDYGIHYAEVTATCRKCGAVGRCVVDSENLDWSAEDDG